MKVTCLTVGGLTDGWKQSMKPGCVLNLGPLPILLPFLTRLRLQETVDSLIPPDGRTKITHGQVLEALVLNRIISPRAMYALSEWSRYTAIPEALDFHSKDLNDGRISRALDAVFPQLEAIQGTPAWHVLEEFELDTSFLHWDMTSFFFEGAYPEEEQDPDAAMVKYGCPKKQDAGKHRKQMQVGFATSEDGGIPFWHRPFSGNAAEISQVSDVMESLKKLVRDSSFTLIGDAKLVSRKNILRAFDPGIYFLGPESRSDAVAKEYLTLRKTQRLKKLAYSKKRGDVYMGLETSFSLLDGNTVCGASSLSLPKNGEPPAGTGAVPSPDS